MFSRRMKDNVATLQNAWVERSEVTIQNSDGFVYETGIVVGFSAYGVKLFAHLRSANHDAGVPIEDDDLVLIK